MHDAALVQQIKTRYRALDVLMDERMRRQWAATEATTYGWGGVSAVSEATGLSRNTIRKGIAEAATLRCRRLAQTIYIHLPEAEIRKSLPEADADFIISRKGAPA